jgi:alkaline phosphatase D
MAQRWIARVALLACAGCAAPGALPPEPPSVTLGPMIGEVRSTSAVLWARGDRVGRLHARIAEEGGGAPVELEVPVFRADDWTARFELHGLRPETRYDVAVWPVAPGAPPGAERHGSFRTAPADHEPSPVRLAFGGDLAGQNVCRHASDGFPIFRTIRALGPDLFVGLGDMIYADGVCRAVGLYGNPQVPGDFEPSARMLDFWAHWRYSREDPAFHALLATTPYVAVWDDHEVVNDFGPHDDTRADAPYSAGEHLMPLGLAAFLDYNPLPERDAMQGRLYRSLRWGRHLELFVLDTRQYRDPAGAADDRAAPKSLLGAAQRDWLEQGLAGSDATWKVVVSSVPLAIPTGGPESRDGWANHGRAGGYERELLGILGTLRDRGVGDTVWITTDVHFAAVHRFAPFGAGGFRLYEVVSGPLNAGVSGSDRMDETLRGERLFSYRPPDPSAVASWEEGRRYFNFGLLEIDAAGILTLRLVNTAGEVLYDLPLEPGGGR